MDIETVTIQAQTRKLKATWSMEAQQDLTAFHSNPAAELTALLAEEIMAEIDREILEDLKNSSGVTKQVVTPEVVKKRKYRSIDDPWEV